MIRATLAGVPPPNGARRWPQRNVDVAEVWLFRVFWVNTAEYIAALDHGKRVGEGKYYEYPLLKDNPITFSSAKLKQSKVGQWLKGKDSKEIFVVSNLGDRNQTLGQLLRAEEVIAGIVDYSIDKYSATKADQPTQIGAIGAKWCLKAGPFLTFLKQTGLIPQDPDEYKKRARHEMVSF